MTYESVTYERVTENDRRLRAEGQQLRGFSEFGGGYILSWTFGCLERKYGKNIQKKGKNVDFGHNQGYIAS